MFRQEMVWDFQIFTIGTVVKLEGYSIVNDFRFKGKEYTVKNLRGTDLIVKSKNGREYSLFPFEIGDDPDTEVSIEIVKQIPWEMPF